VATSVKGWNSRTYRSDKKQKPLLKHKKAQEKLPTARRMEPTHNSDHYSSSVLSKKVSLSLDVESPDNASSTGMSTEMARILARAPDRSA